MDFIDIDQKYEKNDENDIDKIYDIDAIKQSLLNILLIKHRSYIKYRRPNFGSQLQQLLFSKMNNVVIDQIRSEIETCIENYEPRVKLISIETTISENNLLITINYSIKSFSTDDSLELKFSILR